MRPNIITTALVVLYILTLCTSGNLSGSIALRADDGHFVCADEDDVVADRDEIGPWEVFKLIDLGYGNIALQAHTGRYVCAEDGGGDDVVADRDEIGPWETFKLIRNPNIGDEGYMEPYSLKTSSIMQESILIIRDTIPSGVRLWIWNGNNWIDSGRVTPCSYDFDQDRNYNLDQDGNCRFKLTKAGYKDYIKKVKINGETKLGRINLVKKK